MPRMQRHLLVWWHILRHTLATQRWSWKCQCSSKSTRHFLPLQYIDQNEHARWQTPYLPSCILLSAKSALRNCAALVSQTLARGPACKPPRLMSQDCKVPWEVVRSNLLLETFPNILNSFHSPTFHRSPMRYEAINYLPWFPKHLMWGLKHSWWLM